MNMCQSGVCRCLSQQEDPQKSGLSPHALPVSLCCPWGYHAVPTQTGLCTHPGGMQPGGNSSAPLQPCITAASKVCEMPGMSNQYWLCRKKPQGRLDNKLCLQFAMVTTLNKGLKQVQPCRVQDFMSDGILQTWKSFCTRPD